MPITNKARELGLAAWTTATVAGPSMVILVRSGHAFDPTFDWLSSIVADEIVATAYARQAASYKPPTVHPDGRVTIDINPTAFGAVGGAVNDTVSGCYLFNDSGVAATSPLVACVPFASEQTTDGTDLTIPWPTGMLAMSPSLF